MTSILKTALEDIKKLDESLDPEDWAGDESMLSITGRVIAALKEAIKNEKTCAELLSEQGYEYSRQTNALIKRHAEQMEAIKNQGGMCAKGQAFKDYVHQRLDAMGVPHSIPESEHDKAGCRIGGRLDYVEAKLKSQGEPVAWLSPNGLQASTSRMLNGTPLCHCTSAPTMSQGEPIAWYNPQNFDPGQSVTFDRAKHDKWPHLFPAPLYACTPTIPEGMMLVPKEPVAVVKHNGLGFPCVDLLGKNGAQYFGLADDTLLYTSAAPKGEQP